MSDAPPGGDRAFLSASLHGMGREPTWSGALSFLRRRYSRDLDGVDVAVAGVPLDIAVSNRPGARLGPAAVRAASAQLAWGPQWPWGFDPFDRLAHGPVWVADAARETVGRHPTYLTFDIDCLDPAFAPGTGTPVVGGPSTAQVRAILRRLVGLS